MPDQDKQCKLFKRLDLACVSFRESRALTEHLLALGIQPGSEIGELYSACCAGIVVTYARPFMSDDGLGSLPNQYRDAFANDEMAELHRKLLEIRNQVFAHRDLIKTMLCDIHPDSHPVRWECRIVISPSASGKGAAIHSLPALLYLLPNLLPEIVSLCQFQIARVTKEAVELLRSMAGNKVYPPGIYTVGKDFPPKVSEALWEWTREAKLRFGGGVCIGDRVESSLAREETESR